MAELDNILEEIELIDNDMNVIPRENGYTYRLRKNPFQEFSEIEFKKRYRLTKDTAQYVVDLIRDDIKSQSNRTVDVSPELQFLITLRYYSKGSYQLELGDLHGVTQSSVSRIVFKVSLAIARQLRHFVRWPNNNNDLKRRFYEVRNFPGAVGCIDCTHIKIKNPDGHNPRLYWGRKGYYSLNVQVVCGPNTEIFNVVSRWRGSAHDSRIFAYSRVKEDFENNRRQGILLGDSGYACTHYMLTPLLNPRTAADIAYNAAHKGTRVKVECCFGQWKNMFKALRRGLEIKLSTSKICIVAMAVLYNIRLNRDNDFEDDSEEESSSDEEEEVPPRPVVHRRRGLLFRDQFIRRYFDHRRVV